MFIVCGATKHKLPMKMIQKHKVSTDNHMLKFWVCHFRGCIFYELVHEIQKNNILNLRKKCR